MRYPACPKCGSDSITCFGPRGNALGGPPLTWHSSRKRVSRLKGESIDEMLDRICYEIEIEKVHSKWTQKIESLEDSYRQEAAEVRSFWISVPHTRERLARAGIRFRVGTR